MQQRLCGSVSCVKERPHYQQNPAFRLVLCFLDSNTALHQSWAQLASSVCGFSGVVAGQRLGIICFACRWNCAQKEGRAAAVQRQALAAGGSQTKCLWELGIFSNLLSILMFRVFYELGGRRTAEEIFASRQRNNVMRGPPPAIIKWRLIEGLQIQRTIKGNSRG